MAGKHYEVHICVFEVTNDTRRICGDAIESIGAWHQDDRSKWYNTVEEAEREMLAVHKSSYSTSLMTIRKLPWLCGHCAESTVDTIKMSDASGGVEATCSKCGAVWCC
jgi:hypothetical protein